MKVRITITTDFDFVIYFKGTKLKPNENKIIIQVEGSENYVLQTLSDLSQYFRLSDNTKSKSKTLQNLENSFKEVFIESLEQFNYDLYIFQEFGNYNIEIKSYKDDIINLFQE